MFGWGGFGGWGSLPLWECGLKSKSAILNLHFEPSLPLWECGLKFDFWDKLIPVIEVTPFMGVWIEIHLVINRYKYLSQSLPLWECGLKFALLLNFFEQFKSLPLWECGLKLHCRIRHAALDTSHSLYGSVD